MSLPSVSAVDTWRTRTAVRLANFCLRLANEQYRAFIKNSILTGLHCASGRCESQSPIAASRDGSSNGLGKVPR